MEINFPEQTTRTNFRISFALIFIPLFLFTGIIGYQIFGPTPFGLADNRDFARVLGPLRLWPAPPYNTDPSNLFTYYVNDYVVGATYDRRIPSSEWLVAALAKRIARIVLPPGTFQLRLMGAIHASIFVIAFGIFLCAIRRRAPWLRILAAAFLILVWTDLMYVQQFNTAYTDAGALAALAVVFAIVIYTLLISSAWAWAAGFTLAGCFLLGTKTQHVTALPFFVAFCVFTGFRAVRKPDRLAWFIAPVAMIASAAYIVTKTPSDYRMPPAFTVVFYKLAVLAGNPRVVLAHFHMPEKEYLKYVGHYVYESMVPSEEPNFRKRILAHVTPMRIASLYLEDPQLAIRVLRTDLLQNAPNVDLSAGYGYTARGVAHPFRLTAWSGIRKEVFVIAPYHPIWLFAFTLLLSGASIFSVRLRKLLPLWPAILLLSLLAVSSFAFASLLDAAETARHLVLFQAMMDLTVVSLALSVLVSVEAFTRTKHDQKLKVGRIAAFSQPTAEEGVLY